MKRLWLILIVVFLSSCATPATSTQTSSEIPPSVTELPVVTATAACISSEPTDDDLNAALDYTGDLFNAAEWEQTHSVSDGKISVTWQNIPQGSVVFLEAILFPCGYEEPDLNHLFNDEYWNTLLAGYDSHELLFECTSDIGLRLYEFEAVSQGFEYEIRYWEENDTDNRIITTMITFPFGSEDTMDEYSAELFPELPNCS